MVASSTFLALLSTLVASSAAKDYLCGDNNEAKISQLKRSGSWNYGTSTNPLEFPMLVQLVYADKKRECAGSLITVRHVLTARECVDGVKPEDISVIYGPRTPYGGNASVKNAKWPNDANVDLAVLELAFAVEISDSTIPVCVGGTSDEKFYSEYKGLHYGPKNKSEDNELARAMYQDVLNRADEKECTKALGDDYNKDTQFCVGKRNQVFAEGIYTGGPILVRHQPSGRFLQVGIALKADAENNYGSATRVTLYQKEIGKLTGCFLIGAGLNSTTSDKQDCEHVAKTTDGRLTFDVEYGINPECLKKTDAKFHFGEQYGAWSTDSINFRVMVMQSKVDPVVPFELGKRLQITVEPSSGDITVECGSEHTWSKEAIIKSVGSTGPHLFYTPQFYLDSWKETPSGCTESDEQYVKIILRDAELWTEKTTKQTTKSPTAVDNAHKITEENFEDLGYDGIVEFGDDNDP